MPISPMMQHYLQTKEQNPNALLFYRLGDFYEMFFDDAKTASDELGLTLTGRDCGLSERAPMCGVPYHAVDVYVKKLIEKGYKVAICEQMEDPALAKGMVKREVVRVITPGTIIEPTMLDETSASYIAAVYVQKTRSGMAYCDLSTGEFCVCMCDDLAHLQGQINMINPNELITNDLQTVKRLAPGIPISGQSEENYKYNNASRTVRQQFLKNVDELGLADARYVVQAAGALLVYIESTLKSTLSHIISIDRVETSKHMFIDANATRSLELLSTISGSKKGSLLSVLDKAATSMGSRLIRNWIEQPLYDKDEIEKRLTAIQEFLYAPIALAALRETLDEVRDIERLLSKIACDSESPRDCIALLNTLSLMPSIISSGSEFTGKYISELFGSIETLDELRDLLSEAISPEAPAMLKDGGVIKEGYSQELDSLRDISQNGRTYISSMEQQEREKTGIKNLRIGYNHVFGYYIDVTKSFQSLVPANYIRKQTLANSERYISEELKELETRILGADESARRLEAALFAKIRDKIKDDIDAIARIAYAIKTIDALSTFAYVARENEYIRPSINTEGVYSIKDGRHPCVENSIGRNEFVPNDTNLNSTDRIMIITGPNMAGKSTYMRQVALIVLMAHIGSFAPASEADIALTGRIFTRVGASDDLYGGRSTFMVEMSEMATILNSADKNSLLLLDEVGRGTSTYDGLSIAWASVEYIASEKCGAKTLFATHYHELSELEGRLDGVINYRVTAKEEGEDVIFLRKLVKGGEDRSYGVAVAKLAGLPKSVITRARQILARLEVDDLQKGTIGQSILDKHTNGGNKQIAFTEFAPLQLTEEIAALDIDGFTPIEALNKLYELKEKARRI